MALISMQRGLDIEMARGGDVIKATTTDAARSVFLRACSALQPADWDGQEAVLRAVDSEGWAVVSKLAVQQELLSQRGCA